MKMKKSVPNSAGANQSMNTANMNEKYKTLIAFLILSSLSILWFKANHLIYQTDTTFPFSPFSNLISLFNYWNFNGFGSTNLANINISYFLIIYFFSTILNIYIAQFLYYYIFVFIAGISTYYLMQSLFISNKIRDNFMVPYVPAILYMYSTYWISNVFTDPTTVFVFYSLLPLVILSLYKILINSRNMIYFGKYNFIFIISIFLFLPEFYSPYLLLMAYVIISFLIFYFLINIKIVNIFKTLVSVTILIISTIAVLAYFLIPIFYGLSSTLSQVSGNSFTSTLHYWTLLNSNGIFYSFLNTGFTLKSTATPLYGWKWFNFYVSYPFFIIINITIPILAFSSLLFLGRFKFYFNKNIYYFYFLAIIGILLQAGLRGPTGFIYNWLFYHIVFIRAFDTLHLWYSPIIYLSYSILIGVFTYMLLEFIYNQINNDFKNKARIKLTKKIQRHGKIIKYIIIIIILLIVMIPSYPLLDGSAVPHGVPSAEVHIPDYVEETSIYLNSRPNVSTILALPIFIDDSEELYPNGGYRGTNPLEYLLKDPIITQLNGLSSVQSSELTDLNSAIYEKNYLVMDYYLSLLNIKYILVLGDYNSTYNPIISPFSISNTLAVLNNSPNMTFIHQFGPYYLYEYNEGHNLVYPAISINSKNISIQYGNNLIDKNINYAYTNWGNKYDNITIKNGYLSIFFNYTINVTWPFFQLNIYNISKTIENYNHILLNFTANKNVTITAQANTVSNEHLWLTSEYTKNGLILNTSYSDIDELQLFLGPNNTKQNSNNHFLITGLTPFTKMFNATKFVITDSSVSSNQSLSNIKIKNIDFLNPTNIKVNIEVNKTGNFTMVLGQNYNQNWCIKNTSYMKVKHILVNSFMNAWLLSFSKTGNFTIHIIFKLQKLLQYSGYFSVCSILLLIGIYMELIYRKSHIFKH